MDEDQNGINIIGLSTTNQDVLYFYYKKNYYGVYKNSLNKFPFLIQYGSSLLDNEFLTIGEDDISVFNRNCNKVIKCIKDKMITIIIRNKANDIIRIK